MEVFVAAAGSAAKHTAKLVLPFPASGADSAPGLRAHLRQSNPRRCYTVARPTAKHLQRRHRQPGDKSTNSVIIILMANSGNRPPPFNNPGWTPKIPSFPGKPGFVPTQSPANPAPGGFLSAGKSESPGTSWSPIPTASTAYKPRAPETDDQADSKDETTMGLSNYQVAVQSDSAVKSPTSPVDGYEARAEGGPFKPGVNASFGPGPNLSTPARATDPPKVAAVFKAEEPKPSVFSASKWEGGVQSAGQVWGQPEAFGPTAGQPPKKSPLQGIGEGTTNALGNFGVPSFSTQTEPKPGVVSTVSPIEKKPPFTIPQFKQGSLPFVQGMKPDPPFDTTKNKPGPPPSTSAVSPTAAMFPNPSAKLGPSPIFNPVKPVNAQGKEGSVPFSPAVASPYPTPPSQVPANLTSTNSESPSTQPLGPQGFESKFGISQKPGVSKPFVIPSPIATQPEALGSSKIIPPFPTPTFTPSIWKVGSLPSQSAFTSVRAPLSANQTVDSDDEFPKTEVMDADSGFQPISVQHLPAQPSTGVLKPGTFQMQQRGSEISKPTVVDANPVSGLAVKPVWQPNVDGKQGAVFYRGSTNLPSPVPGPSETKPPAPNSALPGIEKPGPPPYRPSETKTANFGPSGIGKAGPPPFLGNPAASSVNSSETKPPTANFGPSGIGKAGPVPYKPSTTALFNPSETKPPAPNSAIPGIEKPGPPPFGPSGIGKSGPPPFLGNPAASSVNSSSSKYQAEASRPAPSAVVKQPKQDFGLPAGNLPFRSSVNQEAPSTTEGTGQKPPQEVPAKSPYPPFKPGAPDNSAKPVLSDPVPFNPMETGSKAPSPFVLVKSDFPSTSQAQMNKPSIPPTAFKDGIQPPIFPSKVPNPGTAQLPAKPNMNPFALQPPAVQKPGLKPMYTSAVEGQPIKFVAPPGERPPSMYPANLPAQGKPAMQPLPRPNSLPLSLPCQHCHRTVERELIYTDVKCEEGCTVCKYCFVSNLDRSRKQCPNCNRAWSVEETEIIGVYKQTLP